MESTDEENDGRCRHKSSPLPFHPGEDDLSKRRPPLVRSRSDGYSKRSEEVERPQGMSESSGEKKKRSFRGMSSLKDLLSHAVHTPDRKRNSSSEESKKSSTSVSEIEHPKSPSSSFTSNEVVQSSKITEESSLDRRQRLESFESYFAAEIIVDEVDELQESVNEEGDGRTDAADNVFTTTKEATASHPTADLNPLNSQPSLLSSQRSGVILNIPPAPTTDHSLKHALVTDLDTASDDVRRHVLETDIDRPVLKATTMEVGDAVDGNVEEEKLRTLSTFSTSSSCSTCFSTSSSSSGGSSSSGSTIVSPSPDEQRQFFPEHECSESPGMSERKSAVKSPALGPRKRFGAWSDRRRGGKGWTCLEAQYAFNYTNEQGRQIDIRRGDRYLLLKRTNHEWWHVLPFALSPELVGFEPDEVDDEFTVLHSFYIPAKYVTEVQMPEVISEPPDRPGHRRQGSTGTNYSATPDWKDDSGASNDGLEPTPQPKPRKPGSFETGPSATAEFKANLEGKISSLPRQDVGLVRMSKTTSLPFDRAGPPSPPSSSSKPVLLPTLPANVQLRSTPAADRLDRPASPPAAHSPPVDDAVIYANIPSVVCPPPPPPTLPTSRHSCMWELPGLKSGGEATGGDRPVISGPIPMEGGACLQNAQKRGLVTKTKLYENGKKMKKNWTQHFLVLSGPSLFFYKDAKAAVPKSGQPNGRPDMSLDLETVRVIEVEAGATKRKHVLAVEDRGAPGSSVIYLLQLNDATRCQEWTVALKFAKDLAANRMYHPQGDGVNTGLGSLHSPKRHRSSMRRKTESQSGGQAGGSLTPTGAANTASMERQTVIKMLKDFFRFRPPVESLEAKGILRNEPVFGTTLELLSKQEKLEGVPLFVTRCIDAIERRDGLNVQGVYRVNGNGATIQKLRCTVDQTTDYNLMESQWDLEVLTGALKLFFRELKEPLIPCASYQKFVDVITVKDKGRVSAMRDLIKKLPSYHHATMKTLFQHLHRVVLRSKFNQMHPRNIAIVFGPNLLWPSPTKQSGSNNEGLTASVMAQNQIVEFILNESEEFFPSPPPLPQRAAT